MTERSERGRNNIEGLQMPFGMSLEPHGTTVFVSLSGEFDLSSKDEFASHLEAVSKNGFRDVVLDLRALTFIDSTGLRLILDLWQRSRQEGFEFALISGPDAVQRVFEVTGLDRQLPIVNDRSELPKRRPSRS